MWRIVDARRETLNSPTVEEVDFDIRSLLLDRAPESRLLETAPERAVGDKRRQLKMENALESLWLWDGDSSGTHEGERQPLEAGTRGLVRHSKPRSLKACVVNCRQTVSVRIGESANVNCN
jgi:hypothetical protein